MNAATITKTVNNANEYNNANPTYSIGFCRYQAIPARVMKNVSLACVLRGEFTHEPFKKLLNEMTEQEFKNWLKLA